MVLGGPGVTMVGLGSKSSQDASECVGIEVERCGSPVRGRIELETCENASIRIDFDAGGSRAHGNIVTTSTYTMSMARNRRSRLGMAPEHVQKRRVRCRNISVG